MSKKNPPFLKDLHLTWWQAGTFKLSAISFGVILAVSFPNFFIQNLSLVWTTFIAAGFYIIYAYFKK